MRLSSCNVGWKIAFYITARWSKTTNNQELKNNTYYIVIDQVWSHTKYFVTLTELDLVYTWTKHPFVWRRPFDLAYRLTAQEGFHHYGVVSVINLKIGRNSYYSGLLEIIQGPEQLNANRLYSQIPINRTRSLLLRGTSFLELCTIATMLVLDGLCQ